MKWKTISDSDVRHIWCDPDGENEIEIDPSWYADNGTPMCGEGEYDGEDMHYVRTEVQA